MAFKITIDVGGTFSDVVVSDFSRVLLIEKSLTTRGRAYDCLGDAFAHAAERLGLTARQMLANTTIVIYGTTRATNSIVERKVARTAFVTTRGFADTLLFREGGKFKPHDFSVPYPMPYIARRDTYEINERIDSEGAVVKTAGAEQIAEVVRDIGRRGFEAAAVSLLWSFANPAHEVAVGEAFARLCPDVAVTLSHQLLPSIREYRRASTVAIDASLKPVMQSYLRQLKDDLAAAGFEGDLFVSTSAGGCAYLDEVIERPVLMVKSGPAMAPLAALAYAGDNPRGDNIIVCDTGGTTFDVGIVRDRRPVLTRETWLGERWTGDLVNIASVDVHSVGAGGGSIAWVDPGGLLRVGPQSAGASPGPACYGRGGMSPTVTDAAVVLGYIDPAYFLGGRIRLDVEAAHRVVGVLAGTLAISAERAASAMMRLANESMIRAIQQITINDGIDPSEAVLVGGGGAAGLGIAEIGRELGCREVIVPRLASAFSAAGMQVADLVFSASRNHFTTGRRLDVGAIRQLQKDMAEELALRARAKPGEPVTITHSIEARYAMQVWELPVEVDLSVADDLLAASLVAAFHAEHDRVFGVRDPVSDVEILLWRAELKRAVQKPDALYGETPADASPDAPVSVRDVYFPEEGLVATGFHRADSLAVGAAVAGPAVILEATTTLVVPPGARALVGAAGIYSVTFT